MVKYTWDKEDHYLTVNYESWLDELFEYDKDMNHRLSEFENMHDDMYYFDLVDMFLKENNFEVIEDNNTYNGSQFLSATIRYWIITIDNRYYYIFMRHFGGDVRGNYGAPYIYTPKDNRNISMNRIDLECNHCNKRYLLDEWGYIVPEPKNENECCNEELIPIF